MIGGHGNLQEVWRLFAGWRWLEQEHSLVSLLLQLESCMSVKQPWQLEHTYRYWIAVAWQWKWEGKKICAECSKEGLDWLYQIHLSHQRRPCLDAIHDILSAVAGQQISCQLGCIHEGTSIAIQARQDQQHAQEDEWAWFCPALCLQQIEGRCHILLGHSIACTQE